MACRCRSVLRAFPVLLVFVAQAISAQPGTFVIWVNDEVVGEVTVNRTTIGPRTIYSMNSLSEVDVIWTQVVRTMMRTEYAGSQLTACHSSVRVNDSVRDSSSLRTHLGRVQGFVHPREQVVVPCTNPWSTARMYYEEPIGQRSIYVESVLRDCPLVPLGGGRYRLTLPNDKVNDYVYRQGVLQEIHVDRPFFDLIFKRL